MDKHNTRELIVILFLDKVRSVPPFLMHRNASHLLSLGAKTAVLVPAPNAMKTTGACDNYLGKG